MLEWLWDTFETVVDSLMHVDCVYRRYYLSFLSLRSPKFPRSFTSPFPAPPRMYHVLTEVVWVSSRVEFQYSDKPMVYTYVRTFAKIVWRVRVGGGSLNVQKN